MRASKEARQYYDFALSVNPKNLKAVKGKSELLLESQDVQDIREGIQTLDALVELNPGETSWALSKKEAKEKIVRQLDLENIDKLRN
jgi:hypothetical protein